MKLLRIKIKDTCYYGDNFTYEDIVIKKEDNDEFDDKIKTLISLVNNGDLCNYEEIENYVYDNFDIVECNSTITLEI